MSFVLADYGPLDIAGTLRSLRYGVDDPTWRIMSGEVWHATHTPAGPATLKLTERSSQIVAEGWGDGSDWMLAHVPELIGMHDSLTGFDPVASAFLASVVQANPGVRLPRTHNLYEALVKAVAAQGVSMFLGQRAYRQLVVERGANAPGPTDLQLLPDARTLAGIPNYELHTYGFEQERAHTLRRIGAQASGFDELVEAGAMATRQGLAGIEGLAPGSIELAVLCAFGDPDALPAGDQRRANQVGAALANEPHADEARARELLEPFRGHRGRVVRLVELAIATGMIGDDTMVAG